MAKTVLIGTDPEFAIFNEATNKYIAAAGIVPGSKKVPFDVGNGCGIQPDGVAVETTQPPVATFDEFINHLNYSKSKALEFAKLQDANNVLKSVSSARYDADQLVHPDTCTFGCDPSYCLYTKSTSPRPDVEDIGNLRSFGFHLHFGFENVRMTFADVAKLMFLMDVYLGLPSIIIDTDTDRRSLYGNAGDFRYNPGKFSNFSVPEYRVLGGFMHSDDNLIKYLWDNAQAALAAFQSYDANEFLYNKLHEGVRTAIDTANVEQAQSILKILKIDTKFRILQEVR